jgi:hypothetical protein
VLYLVIFVVALFAENPLLRDLISALLEGGGGEGMMMGGGQAFGWFWHGYSTVVALCSVVRFAVYLVSFARGTQVGRQCVKMR